MSVADAVVVDVGDLPTLPDVAIEVLDLASSEDASAKDLESALHRDVGLATRVLRVSNSAHYAVSGTVSTLSHAVVILGANRLRSLVLAACTESLCRGAKSSFKDRILWQHSVAAGIVSRLVAERCAHPATEEAFVSGLLHDIGKAVLDTNRSREYQDVVQRVYNRQDTFIGIERETFGFDHAQVGALVAEKWSLASPLREAIEHHHDPTLATCDPSLSAIVSLANAICVKLEIGPEKRPDVDLASHAAVLQLGMSAPEVDELLPVARERVDAEQSSFAF